jgi:casein kinase II subunit alpha
MSAAPLRKRPSASVVVRTAAAVVVAALASSFIALSPHHAPAAPGSKSNMSKARVYTDINVVRPKEYWDYEALTVQWG